MVAVSLAGCGKSNPKALPTIYIIESGKTGWVKITYNRADESELPVENGFVVARIGRDLKLFTRTRMNPTWDGSKFYYRKTNGTLVQLSTADDNSRRIWAQEKIERDDGEREDFFVGDPQQLSRNFKGTKGADIGLSDAATNPAPSSPVEEPNDPTKVLTELPNK